MENIFSVGEKVRLKIDETGIPYCHEGFTATSSDGVTIVTIIKGAIGTVKQIKKAGTEYFYLVTFDGAIKDRVQYLGERVTFLCYEEDLEKYVSDEAEPPVEIKIYIDPITDKIIAATYSENGETIDILKYIKRVGEE